MAYHESGHALVAEIVPTADPVHKVTIVPRGRAMGVTQQLPERDRYMIAQPMLRDRLAVMMGGRAAELMVLQCPTSGAENDLKEAYRLARKMVLDWGMSEKLENLALGSDREHVFLGEELTQQRPYSEATAREIDLEIKKIVTEAAERANEVLRNHHSELERIADRLLAVEELSGEDVRSLMSEAKPSPKSAHG
jgi:cell division protease FtsH